jgi:hypothetical protein
MTRPDNRTCVVGGCLIMSTRWCLRVAQSSKFHRQAVFGGTVLLVIALLVVYGRGSVGMRLVRSGTMAFLLLAFGSLWSIPRYGPAWVMSGLRRYVPPQSRRVLLRLAMWAFFGPNDGSTRSKLPRESPQSIGARALVLTKIGMGSLVLGNIVWAAWPWRRGFWAYGFVLWELGLLGVVVLYTAFRLASWVHYNSKP